MINKVILVGNIGADAEVKSFSENARKATFSLATADGYFDKKNNNQWVDQTDWHNVEVWNPSEHFIANAFKGTTLYVEGKLKCNSYDDANGQKKYFYFIKAEKVRILKYAGGGTQAAAESVPPAMNGGFGNNEGNDDLPF